MTKREKIAKENIEAIECRHVSFCPAPEASMDDYHLIKEVIHTKDGRKVPNLRIVKNYKRPFWVTRPGFQNHQQKKEWEFKDRLQEFPTRESDLERSIQHATNNYSNFRTRRQLFRSPYIYGADISARALLKKRYMDNFKGSPTAFSVCVLDIETDVVHGHGDILMITVSMKDKVFTAVVKDFVEGIADVKNQCMAVANKYLLEVLKARGIQWEIDIVDSPVKAIFEVFKRVHQWMPDYLAVWNLSFDLPRIIKALDKEGIDPAQVFCDPSIPNSHKSFRFNKGPIQRRSSSGVVTTLKPAQQWDTATLPASYQFIDAMQAYYHIRTGTGELQSYGLNAIADKHVKMQKLRFKEDEHILDGTLEWHRYMQANCQINYIVYNIFDCIIMEILDEETNDLAFTISIFGGASELEIFSSQPRRKCVELHFELMEEHGRVLATASDQMWLEADDLTYSLSDWIN